MMTAMVKKIKRKRRRSIKIDKKSELLVSSNILETMMTLLFKMTYKSLRKRKRETKSLKDLKRKKKVTLSKSPKSLKNKNGT